jgi:hypothetical protein
MEMNDRIEAHYAKLDQNLPCGGRIFNDPEQVVACTELSGDAKREMLASWASDQRVVEGFPNLRRLDSGAIVEVSDILDCLRRLDEDADGLAANVARAAGVQSSGRKWRPYARRLHQPAAHRMPRSHGSDDEPPPSPSLGARPLVMPFVSACAVAEAGKHAG